MIKILAIAVAFVLSLGITSSAFAQATNDTTTPAAGCDPSYPDVCITPRPPDLDCKEIGVSNFIVIGNDPHDFDRDSDGVGCEKPGPEDEPTVPTPGNETTEPETPEIPIEVNETIPIPVPSNETTQNETIPVPLPVNETGGGNETVPVPELPVEPEVPPTGETGNQTEELPVEIPATNETDTTPIEIPINSTTGNETIPVPPIEVTPPVNETGTGNETTEAEPLPPVIVPGNVTEPPVEGNVTEPTPEPEPSGNATDAFDQLQNSTAQLDQKLDEVLDNGNEENRAELKAALDETADAIGGTSGLVVNATNDQLLILQGTFVSGSESIDEVLNGDAEEEDGNGDNGE